MHSYSVCLFLNGQLHRSYTIEACDMEHASLMVMGKWRNTFNIKALS